MVATQTLVKIAVGGGLLVCGTGLLVQRLIRRNFCRQDFYIQSLDVLHHYPSGSDIFGRPIEVRDVDLADRSKNWTDGNNAKVAIPLKGRRHSGILHTWSTRVEESKWRVDKADIEIQDKCWTFYIHPDVKDEMKPTNTELNQTENKTENELQASPSQHTELLYVNIKS